VEPAEAFLAAVKAVSEALFLTAQGGTNKKYSHKQLKRK